MSLPGDPPNNDPGESSHKDIAGEHKQQEKTPTSVCSNERMTVVPFAR